MPKSVGGFIAPKMRKFGWRTCEERGIRVRIERKIAEGCEFKAGVNRKEDCGGWQNAGVNSKRM